MMDILSDESLRSFRNSFSDKNLFEAAAKNLIEKSAPIEPMLDFMAQEFFSNKQGGMEPKDRERCLIWQFAVSRDEMPLKIHLYWGLMVGLSVEQILDIFHLAAAYCGISTFYYGSSQLEETLGVMKEHATQSAFDSQSVLKSLSA